MGGEMLANTKTKIHLEERGIGWKPAAKHSIWQETVAKIMKEAKVCKEEHFAKAEKCNSTEENLGVSMPLCSWKYYSNCY